MLNKTYLLPKIFNNLLKNPITFSSLFNYQSRRSFSKIILIIFNVEKLLLVDFNYCFLLTSFSAHKRRKIIKISNVITGNLIVFGDLFAMSFSKLFILIAQLQKEDFDVFQNFIFGRIRSKNTTMGIKPF